MIPDHVWQSYTLHGPVRRLSGGLVEVYRVGHRIVKPFHRTSLENSHSLQLLPWLTDLLAGISQDGFRICRPIPSHDSPWGFAHKHCWGKRPDEVHPVLAKLVDELYARLEPLPSLPCQLIHGDLNHENILVAPGLAPGFIDFTPFWAPVDFALAMFANWMGPRRDDPSVLRRFHDIAHFDQLFIRAAIRMLLVMSPIGKLDDWDTCPEKRAAEIVLNFVS